MRRSTLAAFAALGHLACYSGDQTAQQARDQATSDLSCPDLIDVTEVRRYTLYKDDHVYIDYRASGCGQSALYHCKYVDSPFGASNSECDLGAITRTTSTLTVNGVPFVPDSDNLCLAVDGAFGVDLESLSGDLLRVIRTPELVDEVIFSSKDGSHSAPFEACAIVHFDDQGTSGDATLDCSDGTWTLKGAVTFQGC